MILSMCFSVLLAFVERGCRMGPRPGPFLSVMSTLLIIALLPFPFLARTYPLGRRFCIRDLRLSGDSIVSGRAHAPGCVCFLCDVYGTSFGSALPRLRETEWSRSLPWYVSHTATHRQTFINTWTNKTLPLALALGPLPLEVPLEVSRKAPEAP